MFQKRIWDIIFLPIAISVKKNKTCGTDKQENMLKRTSVFKAVHFVSILNSSAIQINIFYTYRSARNTLDYK